MPEIFARLLKSRISVINQKVTLNLMRDSFNLVLVRLVPIGGS